MAGRLKPPIVSGRWQRRKAWIGLMHLDLDLGDGLRLRALITADAARERALAAGRRAHRLPVRAAHRAALPRLGG